MYKTIWLYLSGFGIMFATLSWCQESGVLPVDLGFYKGLGAAVTGYLLYRFVGLRMDA